MRTFFLVLILFLISVECYETSRKKLFVVRLKRVNVRAMRKKLAKKLLLLKHSLKSDTLKQKISSRTSQIPHLVSNHHISLVGKKKFQRVASQMHYRVNDLAKVELTNYGDIQYWGNLGFKSNSGKPKDFNVLFDTGSSWLWLPSSQCDSCAKYNIRNYYQTKEENKPEGIYTIHYGKGSVEGDIIKDSFLVDGKEINNQYFLEIKKMKDMPVLMFDGLIGLGPKHNLDDDAIPSQNNKKKETNDPEEKKIKQVKIKNSKSNDFSHMDLEDKKSEKLSLIKKKNSDHLSFLLNLKEKGVINEPVFSVYLSSKEKKHKNPPSIVFGGYLDEHKDGDFSYFNSNADKGHWTAEYNGLKVKGNGNEYDIKKESDKVLIDSGTSMITFPQEDFSNYMNTLKNFDSEAKYRDDIKEIYLPNTHEDSKIPSLSFNIGGKEFDLNPEDYAYAGTEHVEGKPQRKGTFMKISPLNLNEKLTILGDPFLQKYYVLFDATENNRRLGIALANHPRHEEGEGPIKESEFGDEEFESDNLVSNANKHRVKEKSKKEEKKLAMANEDSAVQDK